MEISKERINKHLFLLRKWTVQNAKASVLLVHGYGEHSGRYNETACRLNNAGFSVFSYDRRGEGETEGKRSVVRDFNIQVEDLKVMITHFYDPKKKTFLFAHSLGGLIAVNYLIDFNEGFIDGLVLSAPLLMPDEDMSPFLQKIAGMLGRILPFLPVVKVDSSLVTRGQEERIAYDNDPLVFHGSTNARTALEFLKAMKYVQEKAAEIKIPFLVMHGSADKLSNPKGSKFFFENASSKDKRIKIFEGLYHEIMREPEKELFFTETLTWLEARLN